MVSTRVGHENHRKSCFWTLGRDMTRVGCDMVVWLNGMASIMHDTVHGAPRNDANYVFNGHFCDKSMGKCKMLVSVDIANWDVRLGEIKSSHTGSSRNT